MKTGTGSVYCFGKEVTEDTFEINIEIVRNALLQNNMIHNKA